MIIRDATEILAKTLAKQDNNGESYNLDSNFRDIYRKEADAILNALLAEGVVLVDGKAMDDYIRKMEFMITTIEERLGIKSIEGKGVLN